VPGRAPPKRQRRFYSGKKRRHTQKAQVLIERASGRILATAFGTGRTHDFRLFRASRTALPAQARCLADSGYLGIARLHANSRTPHKSSKLHPLTGEQKAENRQLSQERFPVEHVIRRLKVFRILSERYRNRRRRFGLRFNLIAAVYNFELDD
jgi:IS5 family transposase